MELDKKKFTNSSEPGEVIADQYWKRKTPSLRHFHMHQILVPQAHKKIAEIYQNGWLNCLECSRACHLNRYFLILWPLCDMHVISTKSWGLWGKKRDALSEDLNSCVNLWIFLLILNGSVRLQQGTNNYSAYTTRNTTQTKSMVAIIGKCHSFSPFFLDNKKCCIVRYKITSNKLTTLSLFFLSFFSKWERDIANLM